MSVISYPSCNKYVSEQGLTSHLAHNLSFRGRVLWEIHHGVTPFHHSSTTGETQPNDNFASTDAAMHIVTRWSVPGCCRALLCRRGTEDQLRVIQLTADHNLCNDEELDRLSQLGIDAKKVRQAGRLAGHFYTRSIGDYHIKNDYRDIDMLRCPTALLNAHTQTYTGMAAWQLRSKVAQIRVHNDLTTRH